MTFEEHLIWQAEVRRLKLEAKLQKKNNK